MLFLRVIPPGNWVLMDDPLAGSTSDDDGTGIWRKLTSAMAAGLAGHGCSIEEWLSCPSVQHSQDATEDVREVAKVGGKAGGTL
jgi:hypothetical protein